MGVCVGVCLEAGNGEYDGTINLPPLSSNPFLSYFHFRTIHEKSRFLHRQPCSLCVCCVCGLCKLVQSTGYFPEGGEKVNESKF